MGSVSVRSIPSRVILPASPPAHWVGNPPTHFVNPWQSAKHHSLLDVLHTRFGNNRNYVPIPETRDELVKVRQPDWGRTQHDWQAGLKCTWLGHASFLVEMPSTSRTSKESRGLRMLLDPVFSERTSPFTFLGPKRYTPTPCQLSDLPEIDLIVISHDHYDHLDIHTVDYVCKKQAEAGRHVQVFAGLNNKHWFLHGGFGLRDQDVHECDWWDERQVDIEGLGSIKITCTPTQHNSGRTPFNAGSTLWCSWVIEDVDTGKKLYFAGDTAYKATHTETPCPEFERIGQNFGPFDLSLLPIGLYSPRDFMSHLHTDPEGSLEIHKAIRSRKSIGMHYGTVRGGLSQHYEDVREPPRRWQECCEKEGKWGSECGLCDVGETVVV
ncbi:hypothetical protein AAFC00_001496 [Neodothiora populina]|uniref:Metallo-beta-lactamase domain-containing protein n=1 Tax=Neodothiora populina TaxID=2781224 RepID=A0ABR3PPC9_9PEZI